jgi:tetratricopeptide (TPR) repeat protein
MIKKLMYDEALKDLSQVAEGSGEYTAALALSADAYRQRGERARALDFYLKAAAANPGHELAPGALLNAAGIYREMNNGQMAVETSVRLIRLYPDRATIDEAWYMLAKTFETDEKVRDLETARRLYRAFIKKAADGEPNFKGSPLLKRVQNDLNYIERKHFRIY